jgi:hypothetical protein
MWNTAPDVERIPTSRPSKRKRGVAPDVKASVKAARDTLYKDIVRALKQAPVWQPDNIRLPPLKINEAVSKDYMADFLKKPAVCERKCIRGESCLGCTCAIAHRAQGYTLGQFVFPSGRVIAGLCIMCLRQGLATQNNDALGEFSICDYELVDEVWRHA